jgi:hypothetical protein
VSAGGITGDFAELERTIAGLEAVAVVGDRLAEVAAPAIEQTAHMQAASGESPTGATWARRKKDGELALQRPALAIEVNGAGNALRAIGDDVLKYHQRGNDRLPVRKTLPDTGAPLPPAWSAAADDSITTALDAALDQR